MSLANTKQHITINKEISLIQFCLLKMGFKTVVCQELSFINKHWKTVEKLTSQHRNRNYSNNFYFVLGILYVNFVLNHINQKQIG